MRIGTDFSMIRMILIPKTTKEEIVLKVDTNLLGYLSI